MTTERISVLSQRMATVTLWLLFTMIFINVAGWILPDVASSKEGYGLAFSLTDNYINNSTIDVKSLLGWQISGAIILSSIPLLALTYGLYHLRQLFQTYADKAYFSIVAAKHLGKVGHSIVAWTMLNLFCSPLLSIWLTMREAEGQRLFTINFGLHDVVALFLAACITLIAYILKQASELHVENQQFV